MLHALHKPLRPLHAIAAIIAVMAGVTLYCLAYTAFSGERESPMEAAIWATINIVPWLVAWEGGKRSTSHAAKAAILGAALALSLAAQMLIEPSQSFLFELVRRVPALLLTAAALLAGQWLSRPRPSASPTELPLSLSQLDWVSAAGNYVELHGAGRTLLHRVPLSHLEAQLAGKGFLRVHRSTLVRRDRIARVRPLDIVLQDGTSLRTGSRYRAALRS